jgi:hypothetical protein
MHRGHRGVSSRLRLSLLDHAVVWQGKILEDRQIFRLWSSFPLESIVDFTYKLKDTVVNKA